MRVLVVGGFLGAGKTTFIQELARKSGRDFCVYENELGQADLDARTLSQTDELSVWESTENCICCSGKQDFASSVLTIANTLDPEYLVVEPTGVAKLSAIVANVRSVSYERIGLLEPVAIVDAVGWTRQKARYEDIYLDQVASASVVVVSKAQLAGEGELEALLAWLAEAAPKAQVVAEPWDRLGADWFCGLLTHDLGSFGPAASAATREEPSAEKPLDTLSLRGASLPSESHLLWLLDALAAGTFGELARAKGLLRCGGQWLRFDLVDRAWQVTGADADDADDAGATVVFIGEHLRRGWLREAFLPAVRDAAAYRTGRLR